MVRRSATLQYNLSQDLMAEALNQANHCFSISPHTQKQKNKKQHCQRQCHHHAGNGKCCDLPWYRQITQTQRVNNKIEAQD
jgi:hypothetical protein